MCIQIGPFARIAGLCVLSFSISRADDKGKPASGPATVENRVKEADLTTIKLTPEAEKRLAIELVAAEIRPIARPRRLPGVVMIPPGRTLVVSAPVAGLVTLPSPAAPPLHAGMRVEHSSPLFRLQPGEYVDGKTFVPADRISLARAVADLTAARIEAEGQLQQARVRADAAEIKLKRADQLRQEGAGAQRALDEAQAEMNLATSQRDASQERVETLSNVLTSLETGNQAAVTIDSPLEGYVRAVYVAAGQVVPSGAPLVEVVAFDPVWVRVPVYVGDLSAVEAGLGAKVRGLTEGVDSPGREARRVAVPGSADAKAATVDLYLELANPIAEFRDGERVSVELSTVQTSESLIVPHAAILFDIYGGTWVYENIAPQTYTRRRVEIGAVIDNSALVSRGLIAGAQVVTAGAAELFGTEFGVGK